jgi:dTDP-4-dehydrorhamnose reductase
MAAAGTPTILLTGGTGQIGSELSPLLSKIGVAITPTRDELDLTLPETIRQIVRRVKPAVIVNAGAYTAVDRAESERDDAFRINADAPAVLAEEAARLGALLVHFSTDYVFDGSKRTPYLESDPVTPINVYGESKARGEQAVVESQGPHLVLRTSWVYGPRGVNFPRTILRLARERQELRVVNDQVGTPTSAIFLAEVTVRLVKRWLTEDDRGDGRWSSLYHLTASDSTTWYDFARSVLERDPRRGEQIAQRVVPITTAEYPTAARRPLYSVLDCTLIERELGVKRTDWRDQLVAVSTRWSAA